MADRKKEGGAGQDSSSERKGTPAQGYGDDQGTHIGRPRESGRENDRDSGQPGAHSVRDGLEGSVLDGGDDSKSAEASAVDGSQGRSRGRTGAGAEAAQGIHGMPGAGGEPNKGTSNRAGEGQSAGGASGQEGDVEHSGSEPLHGSSQQHRSGYGGRGGAPDTSSDQRRPQDTGSRGNAELGDEEAGDGADPH